jgi:hypothetical protein
MVKKALESNLFPPGPERRRLPILLAQVKSEPVSEFPKAIASLMEECTSARYFIDSQFGDLVLASTAPLFKDSKTPTDVNVFCKQLMEKMPNIVRALYGEADCLYGDIGSSTRSRWGIFVLRLESYLDRLFQLQFGEVERV